MTSLRDDILTRADRGESVAEIAAAVELTPGRVYKILRDHRPDRLRKARERTSDIPDKVRGLVAAGKSSAEIVDELGITRQYVHRILAES